MEAVAEVAEPGEDELARGLEHQQPTRCLPGVGGVCHHGSVMPNIFGSWFAYDGSSPA